MTTAFDQNVNTAANIGRLLEQLVGKGNTTTTKQTLVNPQDIMKQLLEASGTLGFNRQGLAGTLSLGRRAGVYGGASNQLNLNDLLSRISTEAAIAGAPTNQTTKQAGILPGGGKSLTAMLGAGLLKNDKARKQVTDYLEELFNTKGGPISDLNQINNPSAYIAGGPSYVGPMGVLDSGIPFVDSNNYGSFDPGGDFSSVPALVDAKGFDGGAGFADYGADYMSSAGGAAGFDGGPGFVDYGADFMSSAGTGVDAALSGASNGFVDYGADYMASASNSFDPSSAMGGFPVVGSLLALSDGKVSGREVASLGGGWAGAKLGTAIFPGVGTVIGGILGSVLGGKCFITTAILTAFGNTNDDAEELQILRKYRDTWLATNHPEDIATYYEIAPAIVNAINSRSDSAEVWTNLWYTYLRPAITQINKGEPDEAYKTYKAMVEMASSYELETA